jgi:hypothetical protein
MAPRSWGAENRANAPLRAQPLDPSAIQSHHGLEHLFFGGAAGARVEKPSEGTLVVGVFVDVGNPELRLPKEGMVGSLEDLALLGDRLDRFRLVGALPSTGQMSSKRPLIGWARIRDQQV